MVARSKGESPWYFLTAEPAHFPDLAWKIEMALCFNKSDLAFESPRLLRWQSRLKLLSMAGLAYSFLLSFPLFQSAFLALAHFLSPNDKVEPGYSSSALSFTSRSQSSLAFSSASLLLLFMRFVVLHVFLLKLEEASMAKAILPSLNQNRHS